MKRVLILSVLLVLCWAVTALAASADQLAKFLPDKLGGFKATTPIKTEKIALPGFAGVTRKYTQGDNTLGLTMLSLPKGAGLTIKPAQDIKVGDYPGKLKITKGEKKNVVILIDLAGRTGGSSKSKAMIMISHPGVTSQAKALLLADQIDFEGLLGLFK